MCVGSYVSGQPSVADVLFQYYAVPVMFGNMAIISSEAFAFAMLLSAGVFLGVADSLQLQGPQWFDFASMRDNSRFLPIVMALVCLVQLTVKHLSSVYKTQRLAAHFIKQDKEKVRFLCFFFPSLCLTRSSLQDEFVRTVTHEIKSPLHGIIGCAQLLAQSCENLTPEQRDQLSVISHASAVLNLLVDNVLSNGHEGMRTVRWERVPLPLFFADLLKLLQNLTYQKAAVFSLHLSPSVPASAVVPRATLMQVILNLGMNAVKHCGGGVTQLHVSFEKDCELLCEVRDSGPGIKNEQLLFSGRPEPSGTSGTGLGLRVCKTLCDAAGCSLGYRPNDVRGSVFFISVPVSVFSRAKGRRQSSAESGAKTSPLLAPLPASDVVRQLGGEMDVLVVDDSKVNLRVR